MNYRLLIRRQAKSDLRQAARWYERQSPGVGREFVAEVEAALNRIGENPLQYQTIIRRGAESHFAQIPIRSVLPGRAGQDRSFCDCASAS